MRSVPEDFQVHELPSFEPAGSGEHLLLTVEKRGMNTAYAARLLAEWAGVPELAIGYAGLKDRHARTVQRFSVNLPRRVAGDPAPAPFLGQHSEEVLAERLGLASGAIAGLVDRGIVAGSDERNFVS